MTIQRVEYVCTYCHVLGPLLGEGDLLWMPTSIVVESWDEAVRKGWLRGIDTMGEPVVLCPEHARTHKGELNLIYPVSLAPEHPSSRKAPQ